MSSLLKLSNRSLSERLFVKENELLKNSSSSSSSSSRRSYFSFYIKCALCILIIYYLNLIFGLKYFIWSEKSFLEEYNLKMTHIDVIKVEENPEGILGQPTNILPNRFVIENEYLCGRSLDPETRLNPHVLILVKSSCQNFKQREAIRLTWGEKTRLRKRNTRLAFVLGTDAHNTSIVDESKKCGDIIQIDKIDYYYYSSYKMIMMLRWINDYCTSKSVRSPHTDLRNYVLFVDDEYYIDIDSLLLYIHSIDEDPAITTYERRTFITGELIEGSRPRRFVSDRYYVPINDYPYDVYPSYISTGCFLMTRYNVKLFYIASKYTRLFHFDDIYMGLLAYSMSINLIRNNELFSTSFSSTIYLNNQTRFLSKWKDIFNKQIHLNSPRKAICIRGYHSQKLILLWNEIYQTNFTL